MKSDTSILRKLHKIQQSVPDKDFFANRKSGISEDEKKRKKGKGGFLSGAPFIGSKRSSKIDVEVSTEKIKSFNNSFKQKGKKQKITDVTQPGLMSIQETFDV